MYQEVNGRSFMPLFVPGARVLQQNGRLALPGGSKFIKFRR